MKTRLGQSEGAREARPLRVSIETNEDYALALQRIAALRGGPRDESEEQELQALLDAIRDWDDGAKREPGYPVE